MDTATRRRRPTTVADLHRLARIAHERQLCLFQEQGSGSWFCSSASDPGALYYVTGWSCTCRGFLTHQRCTHHALLLERLGWLPPVAEAQSMDEVLAGEIAACLSEFEPGPGNAPIVTTTDCTCGALDPELSCPLRRVVASVAKPELAHVTRCPECHGDGYVRISMGGLLSEWVPGTCHRCQGAGTVAMPIAS